ncbi:hypothetical protein G5V65_12965 [Rhodobacter sp. HX-7-19]|uniref:Methyl-accepting chemotaxis protein n=1 Tax=Paragemmobacter kunshanensis TaxID=2583234 RepID=A0A6M1TNX6_9RHOB|nr:hypothetical protein [Rhodobacter kunshanensis]NGQ91809.1 hypothetical protein [Rhodobacter kunshanensis]
MTAGRMGAGMATGGADALQPVLRITEDSFVAAGDALARGIDILHATEAQFARLDQGLGDAAGAELGRLITRTFGNVATIRADFDGFLAHSDALRGAVRAVRMEVADLDRVVRTISNVSINARIQGNGLVPPRPQVNSFIERLAAMSQEAEAILQEVKEAMVGIGHDTGAMEAALQDLRQELLLHVLPTLSRFAAIAQRVQDGRAEMARTSGELAARMKAIFAEVSRLVMALQSGDATRQRLERVQEVLGEAEAAGAEPGLEAVLVDLARALAEAARTEGDGEVAVSVAALEAVQARADQAMAAARQVYLAQAGVGQAGGGSDAEGLEASLARVQRHLAAMRGRAEALGGRLDVILKHEATIRQIAQSVRLSGLNAVLICAKLGEEGRSLRELAQWLRTLTDESDAIVQRLQGDLAQTRSCAEAAGQAGVDHLEASLAVFIGDAGALNAAMGRITALVAEAAQGFDAAGRELPMRLGQAAARLGEFRAALGDVAALGGVLGLRRLMLADPALPLPEGGAGAAVLARLRARCTMQAEREILDRVTAAGRGAAVQAMPPAPVAVAAAATDEDLLDDILF